MAPNSAPRPEFRRDLEGLRGVAILLVVLFHAGVSQMAGGFVGVDVFFVLSGFFITGILVRELSETGSVNLTDFYGKRALRLLPPLMVVLLVTLLCVMWLYAPIDRADIATTARAVALYSANSSFASNAVDYFSSGENPLLHTWSLAVEQQFYLVWPVLFVFVGMAFARRTIAHSDKAFVVTHAPLLTSIAIAGVVSFVASLMLTASAQPTAFFSMPTRVWEFALGGALALVMNTRSLWYDARAGWLQVAGLLAIAFAVVTYNRATPYPGIAAALPACATLALLIGGQFAPLSTVSKVLATPPLRWLGQVSYTWYLWHWPLVGLGGVLNPHIGVWGKLAWCAAALALAWLTYQFVEQRWRNGSMSALPAKQLALAAFGATVFAALAAQISIFASHREEREPAQRVFAAARGDRMHHDCWATTVEALKGPCTFGDVNSSTVVVLFGDSHAEHWLGGLDKIGRDRGWKIVAMVKGGCPVADMPELMHVRLKRYYHECTRFREAMVQRIIALKPAAAILSSWDHYMPLNGDDSDWKVTPEMWQNGLRRTYSRLSAAGVPVVAIRGTPRTFFNVPSCLSRKAADLLFAGSCQYDRSSALSEMAAGAQSKAATGLGVRFVDMNDQICATATCGVMRNGVVIFTDDNHLTASFSRSAADVFGARIRSAALALGASLP